MRSSVLQLEEPPIDAISQPGEMSDKLNEIGVQYPMIAYALLFLNIKRGLGMFEQHSQVRASDSFQAASYHYLLANFVGQVCIDENLGLLGAHEASIDDADTQTPAESLITASIGNLKMFGEKYEKLCAKHFGVQCTNPGNASSSA